MPDKLITNEKIPIAIFDLIDEAKEYLILVSPYLKLWGHLVNHLEQSKAKKKIAIIRDENMEEKAEVIASLKKLGITVKARQNLHAKIYLSDKSCVISSMNLYEFSAANSEEIAVIITDKTSLLEIEKYVKNLNSKSADIDQRKVTMIKDTPKNYGFSRAETKNKIGKGHCIRCGNAIKLDAAKPYCPKCYESWALYENEGYKEKFCHVCGKEEATTILKPVCRTCFKKGF
jgi:phosphatidylserine/phosphatidylglycerophosphate/cardiolipin synthase-like enzyme